MSLLQKWYLRELVRDLLFVPISFTGVLLILCFIKMKQFYSQGFEMYPGLPIPKGADLHWILGQFWELSLSPYLSWIWLTLILDALIRRYVFRLSAS